jgi:pyruvate/oxaloacetate carboxyltransferase
MYRYLGRYIDTSGLNNQYFTIVLIIDGIDASITAIVSMSMSMSQPITSMALSLDDDDTIDDASMADP